MTLIRIVILSCLLAAPAWAQDSPPTVKYGVVGYGGPVRPSDTGIGIRVLQPGEAEVKAEGNVRVYRDKQGRVEEITGNIEARGQQKVK